MVAVGCVSMVAVGCVSMVAVGCAHRAHGITIVCIHTDKHLSTSEHEQLQGCIRTSREVRQSDAISKNIYHKIHFAHVARNVVQVQLFCVRPSVLECVLSLLHLQMLSMPIFQALWLIFRLFDMAVVRTAL
jgi:hypothetical protein